MAIESVVVRLGGDIPVHGVMRFNELAASRAAGAAGISPKVLYAAPMAMALEYISGRTYEPEDMRANRRTLRRSDQARSS